MKSSLASIQAQFEKAARERLPKLLPIPLDSKEFVSKCCFTQDAHAKSKGLDYVRPLISDPEADDYLLTVTDVWVREPRLTIKKSRQVRITWLLTALHLHAALVNAGELVAYQAVKFDFADAFLRDRFWWMYERIPTTYIKPRARYVEGAIEVFHTEHSTLPTSQIIAIAQGEEQVRQWTFSRKWSDEFASQEKQQETFAAAKPAVDGGGRDTLSSSSKGSQTFFYKLQNEDMGPDQYEPVETLREGVQQWKRNGYCHLWVGYNADANKRPGTPQGDAWLASAKSGTPTRDWMREMEGDDTVQPGDPVYDCGAGADGKGGLILKPQNYVPGYPIWRGWDFGARHPFVVFSQIRPKANEQGDIIGDRIHYIWEYTLPNSTTEELCQRVTELCEERFPHAAFKDACDFYGGNQRNSKSPLTDVQILNANSIYPQSTAESIKMGVEIGQKLINYGDCEVDPVGCPTLTTALRSGYVRGETGELPTEREKEQQHPYCDCADAYRYTNSHAFRFVNLQKQREDSVRRPEPMQQPHRLNNPVAPRGGQGQRESSGVRRPVGMGDWKRNR